ncbi:MAG: hypothetical protein C5B49_13175 [Bdellovibrio sp.]|nr:MAG: hypothetical protein C5B49_13175 [Bdellovibrio sp.]
MLPPVTLIFLHGGPGLPDYLETSFKGQFAPDLEVDFYTQKQTADMNEFIDEVDEHVKKARSQKVVLVGHSWGSILAIEYARKHSDRVHGLVLIDGVFEGAEMDAQFEKLMRERGITDQSPLEQKFLSSSERVISPTYATDLLKQTNTVILEKIYPYISKYSATSFFQDNKKPILNIFGEEDIRTPASILKTFGRFSATVRNHEIRGAGHFPFIREVDRREIAKEIESFARHLN